MKYCERFRAMLEQEHFRARRGERNHVREGLAGRWEEEYYDRGYQREAHLYGRRNPYEQRGWNNQS